MESTKLITKKDVSFTVYMMTGDNDGWGFWNHVVSGVWEPHTWEILHRFLSKDKTYVDIGAWVGPTVLFGAQLSKRCVAFEPDPHAFAAIQTNLKLNPQITNAECHQLAIGNSNGMISMGTNSKQGDSMSSLLFANNGSWQVESVTLKDAFDRYKIEDCNFIKMDIEGGESLVLPAIKDFVQDLKPTFYLALHTAWISDKETFFNNVRATLAGYKNIYGPAGNKISLDMLPALPGFTEVLATNEEW